MSSSKGKEAPVREGKNEMDAMQGLPIRVSHLERTVDSLHQDSILTQSALASITSKINTFGDVLKDLSNKLDVQRTRRPDMAALASWAAVLLMMGGLMFGGLAWRMSLHEQKLDVLSAEQLKFAVMQGQYMEKAKQVDAIEQRMYEHSGLRNKSH